VLNDAGGVYLRRYWARGGAGDLDAALQLWQAAVTQTPPDSPALPMYLNNLGTGLRETAMPAPANSLTSKKPFGSIRRR
jgi:hypothetical protein